MHTWPWVSQKSRVQPTLSEQGLGPPPRQLPPLQKSLIVQKFPSLQLPETGVREQLPVAVSHASVVQEFPSSQLTAGWLHSPVAGAHTSCVQRLASPQSLTVPWQVGGPVVEAMQMSEVVHRLRSSQEVPGAAGIPAQRIPPSQVSEVVQEFPSSQSNPAGLEFPVQMAPLLQASPVVHDEPSSQAVPAATGVCAQPPPGGLLKQRSFVQGLWSSQLRGSCRHVPVVVSHESTVQASKSLQSGQTASGVELVGPAGKLDENPSIPRAMMLEGRIIASKR